MPVNIVERLAALRALLAPGEEDRIRARLSALAARRDELSIITNRPPEFGQVLSEMSELENRLSRITYDRARHQEERASLERRKNAAPALAAATRRAAAARDEMAAATAAHEQAEAALRAVGARIDAAQAAQAASDAAHAAWLVAATEAEVSGTARPAAPPKPRDTSADLRALQGARDVLAERLAAARQRMDSAGADADAAVKARIDARCVVAELQAEAAIEAALPALAMLRVVQFAAGGSASTRFVIEPSEEALTAARTLLDAELSQ